MKSVYIVIGVIVAIIGLAAVAGGGNEGEDNVSYSIIQTDVSEGAAFLDVRTAEEYSSGHAQGADLFPLQTMQAGTLPQLEKDSTVYVYCRSGSRSAQATNILENAGFTNVVDLGGIADVQSLGAPIVR